VAGCSTTAEGNLDAPALLDQPDPSTLIVAVATLERERAIAVAYWTIVALKQQKLRPEFCGLKEGGHVRARRKPLRSYPPSAQWMRSQPELALRRRPSCFSVARSD